MAKKFGRNIKARQTNTAENRALKTDDEGSSVSLTPRGDFSINPNLNNVRLERVGRCYRGGKAVLRIWNTRTATDPNESLDPGRIGPRQDQLGGMSLYGPCAFAPWVGITNDDIPNCKAQVASFVVSRQTPSTRSLKWKRDTYNIQKENIPFWELPYPTFFHSCQNAYEAGEFGSGGAWDPKWNKLMHGGKTSTGTFREAAISTMKNRYFVVGHVLELGENMDTIRMQYTNRDNQLEVVERGGVPYGLGEEDPLYVMWMSSDCGSKILELCQRKKEEDPGVDPDENPAALYQYGDPCGVYSPETGAIKGGVFFTIFNPQVWQPENNQHSSWNGVIPGDRDVSSYQVKVAPGYTSSDGTKFKPSMSADEAGRIFECNLFGWKEEGDDDDSYLLHETSVEEEATLTARAFADVPKLLEFAWMSHPEYLQYDAVQAIVKSRTSFNMPEEAYEDEEVATEAVASEAVASDDDFDAFEDVGGGDGPLVSTSPTDAALDTTPDDEFTGGEIEEETASADDDEDFEDLAATFSSDFEEDEGASADFDPDEEASDIEASMSESMSKANSALAKSDSSGRTSPKRKLKKRGS